MESYIQETARAGRDEQPALIILLKQECIMFVRKASKITQPVTHNAEGMHFFRKWIVIDTYTLVVTVTVVMFVI